MEMTPQNNRVSHEKNIEETHGSIARIVNVAKLAIDVAKQVPEGIEAVSTLPRFANGKLLVIGSPLNIHRLSSQEHKPASQPKLDSGLQPIEISKD